MKQTYIILILIALVVLGLVVFTGNQKEHDATQIENPTSPEPTNTTEVGTIENQDNTLEEPVTPQESEKTVTLPEEDGEESPDLVACTLDAKICPDGSAVGRVAPTCEFAACPTTPVVETPEPLSETPIEVESEVKVFNVTGVNYAFNVEEIRVKKGDTVTINFESGSGFHDWVIDEFDAATAQVRPGTPTSVTFVADTTGSFEYYCSVGSHRAQGMVGTLIVE